jgi:hypothetical protein
MCELHFAAYPTQESLPGDEVSSADDLAGDLFGPDRTAQGVFTDVDAAGRCTLYGLLDVEYL